MRAERKAPARSVEEAGIFVRFTQWTSSDAAPQGSQAAPPVSGLRRQQATKHAMAGHPFRIDAEEAAFVCRKKRKDGERHHR